MIYRSKTISEAIVYTIDCSKFIRESWNLVATNVVIITMWIVVDVILLEIGGISSSGVIVVKNLAL